MSHLDNRIVRWVGSLLTERVQYTRTGPTSISDRIVTNTGTPQGTVLSPVLFTIYTDIIRSSTDKATVIKFADDTVVLGLIADPLVDNEAYFNEVHRLADICYDNDLLLNASKTHEIVFTTQRICPEVPQLYLNGMSIDQSTSVKYLGITLDSKLRFKEHVQNVVTKAKQRLYLVRRFSLLGADNKLVTQLFRSFIESILLYCIVPFYSHLFSNEKKYIRSIFKTAIRYGANINSDIDILVSQKAKQYILRIYHDDKHFIHDILEKLPSGRLRAHKVRSALGRDCFYTHLVKLLNDIVF
jgi:hypothetical protein